MVYKCFKIKLLCFRVFLEYLRVQSFDLTFKCHQFEINQHPIAEVMPVLLKSGQSASREEVVEEMKDCRSTMHPCHRSTPRSYTKLPKYPWTTKNHIYVIYKPLLTATLSKLSLIHSSRLGEKGRTPSDSSWNSYGPSKKEPDGLCRIRKSTREVWIDTLQAKAIDNVHHQSIDNLQEAEIDRANQPSNNTIHPATVHRVTAHCGTVYLDTVHPVLFIEVLFILTIFIPRRSTLFIHRQSTLFNPRRSTLFIPCRLTLFIPRQSARSSPIIYLEMHLAGSDIKTAFLRKFLYEASATRQKKFNDMLDKMIKDQ
ncbi:hypothetical protein IGI04_035736 [Brassica rapa subsp. trilocularis]|uniref:Uncharacterized protein n=1 Tax=Brassica rapa subsp. trilocularis TaxID=1813537 RepID=A0ABQ7LES6_BRACM|nr:hypothetical protein IGI04_035736 [Brassica rapa subsp. trilocularis]